MKFLLDCGRLDDNSDFGSSGEAIVLQHLIPHLPDRPLVILDVGANVGMWTKLVASQCQKIGRPFHLHAFEPTPETYKHLCQNVVQWELLSSVNVYQDAISKQTGFAEFYTVGADEGRNSIYSFCDDDGPTDVCTVKTVSLDEFCVEKRIEHISYLKIDCEGHDQLVLEGAKNLLKERRVRAVQFEYNHRWIEARRFLKDAFTLLTSAGYEIGKMTRHGVEFYSAYDYELESFRECNFLALPSGADHSLPMVQWWKNDMIAGSRCMKGRGEKPADR